MTNKPRGNKQDDHAAEALEKKRRKQREEADEAPPELDQPHHKPATKRPQPSKPAAKKNPVGVDHNPAQGGPSTRRNPEAGKKN